MTCSSRRKKPITVASLLTRYFILHRSCMGNEPDTPNGSLHWRDIKGQIKTETATLSESQCWILSSPLGIFCGPDRLVHLSMSAYHLAAFEGWAMKGRQKSSQRGENVERSAKRAAQRTDEEADVFTSKLSLDTSLWRKSWDENLLIE